MNAWLSNSAAVARLSVLASKHLKTSHIKYTIHNQQQLIALFLNIIKYLLVYIYLFLFKHFL